MPLPGVDPPDLTQRWLDHALADRAEDRRLAQLVGDGREEGRDGLRGAFSLLRVNRHRAHGERHDERGLVAMTRDIADQHADAPATKAEEMIEIAADTSRRLHARGAGRV